MMYKSAGISVLAVIIGTYAVQAADLPSARAPLPPPPPVAVFTWEGPYVGAQIGYGFGRDSSLVTATATGAGLAGASANENGVIGGAHLGYNFTGASVPFFGGLGSSYIVGIEGDVDITTARAKYYFGNLAVAGRDDIQGSVRGRIGYAAGRALFYATGGVALGGLNNSYTNGITNAQDSIYHNRTGYTVGAGIEYAVIGGWSARVEYRYTDFGTYSDVLSASTAGGATDRHRISDNRVQAGFSYKFSIPGYVPAVTPVVAKY